MPNNSCTVILNVHGVYDSSSIINLTNFNQAFNYNLLFLCKLKQVLIAVHHNLIIADFATDGNHATLAKLELLSTTTIVNRHLPNPYAGIDVIQSIGKHSCLSYEHQLSNAPDVTDAELLSAKDPRYITYRLMHNLANTDPNMSFLIEVNKAAVEQDAAANLHELSINNLIFITPIAPDGSSNKVTLSELLQEIIPNIRFIVLYNNANHSADLQNLIYHDNFNMGLFQVPDQDHEYRELSIAGDANIVWDAFRVEA